jgi:tRNA nucleotidyltransferase (CCA-adding enzyme)
LLEHYSPEAILANALASDSSLARQRLHLFLDELRYVKLSLDGEDLKRLGASPGSRLGRMLQALHEAKLDGEAKTRQEEEELAGRWLRLKKEDF